MSLSRSIAFALLFVVGAWLSDPFPSLTKSRVVRVDIEVSGTDSATWYTSIDGPFSEGRHATLGYAGRTTLEFEVPDDARFNRLDPGGRQTLYRLFSIAIVEKGGRSETVTRYSGAELFNALSNGNQVALSQRDGVVEVQSLGNDPYVSVAIPRLDRPAALLLALLPRLCIGALIGFLFGAFARLPKRTAMPGNERVWFIALFIALYAASLLPFALTPYPPLIDAGLHAAAGAIWHYHADPAWHFKEYYDLQIGLAPYWAYYGSINALASLFGAFRAAWLLTVLAVAMIPISSLLLLRALDQSRWPALLTFGFLYTYSFNSGFIALCLGFNLTLLSIAACVVFLQGLRWWAAVFVAVSGVAIYFFHILAWGAWGLGMLTTVFVPARRWGWRRIVAALLITLPGVAIGALVTLRGSSLHMGHTGELRFVNSPVAEDLKTYFAWIWDACNGGESTLVGAVLVALLAVVVALNWRRNSSLDAVLPVLAVLMLVCYVALPRSVVSPAYWWAINVRFAMPSALFLALSLGTLRPAQRPIFAACLLLVGWLVVDANKHWYETAPTARGLQALESIPEPGDRVFFLMHFPHNDKHYAVPYKRYTLAGYYQSRHGGFLPWNFDDAFPLRYRLRFPGSPFNIPNFRGERHARYYDYVFVLGGAGEEVSGAGGVKVGEANGWTLFKLPGPRDDTPPSPPYPSDPSFW